MENTVQTWSSKTKFLWIGVLIMALAGITARFFGLFNFLGALTILIYLLKVGVVAGFALYILGLIQFRSILGENDAKAVNKIFIAAIIGASVAFLDLILGWVIGFGIIINIANIVAWILAIIGFASLKGSATFPAKARSGASKLFIAMLLNLIGGALALLFGWVPIVTSVIVGIIYIVAFIMMLIGWSQIKSADPAVL
ncbi:hypothetical protein LJC45_01230 [Alistipes sp. OttesenSCG-928-B03]|nr:hypothetical protein [Alistipes sp. OttesenSCG-928-B03]